MEVKETNLHGVYVLEPKVFGDERGFLWKRIIRTLLKKK